MSYFSLLAWYALVHKKLKLKAINTLESNTLESAGVDRELTHTENTDSRLNAKAQLFSNAKLKVAIENASAQAISIAITFTS